MAEDLNENYAREFHERRRTTWRLSIPWFVALMASSALGALVGKLNNSSPKHLWMVELFAIALLLTGISGLIFIVLKHYRCPACGEVISSWNGVPIFPKKCPRCNVSFVRGESHAD